MYSYLQNNNKNTVCVLTEKNAQKKPYLLYKLRLNVVNKALGPKTDENVSDSVVFARVYGVIFIACRVV